jgi:ADP-ribose pyrophosphatase YjhB (NUDIX family)
MEPAWLDWARRLNALAQSGLTYAESPYDIERYTAIRTIAAEMIAHESGADTSRVLELFACDDGYATPKVDVRGVVFQDSKILLVQERSDGMWTLPGGWADVGDSPADAVVREIREESGYKTRATKLLALLDRNRHDHPPHVNHIYKVFIRCEIIGGSPTTSHEIQGVGFFAEDRIPALSLTRTVPAQITRMFEHYRQPDLPADFDDVQLPD